MNHSPEGAQGSANSKTPERPDLRDYRGDGSTSDYINDVNEYCDHVERQLAQSEERVALMACSTVRPKIPENKSCNACAHA